MPQYPDGDPRLIPEQLQHKSGPVASDVRVQIKEKILEVLGQTQNIQAAVESAGISRATFFNWKYSGFITPEDLEDAKERYRDFIRGEIQKQFMRGSRRPLLQNGRLVKDDNDQPIWIDHPDTKLLAEVAKHWLPEWQNEKKEDEQNTTLSGIPAQFLIQLDARELTTDEFMMLKKIVLAVEERKAGIVVVEAG